MINKIEMNVLLDYYENLLTDKQKNICESYYRDDLSYQEIAEVENISRAAVYDTVKRCNEELLRYEAVLHLAAQAAKRQAIYTEFESLTLTPEIKQLIDRLKDTEM